MASGTSKRIPNIHGGMTELSWRLRPQVKFAFSKNGDYNFWRYTPGNTNPRRAYWAAMASCPSLQRVVYPIRGNGKDRVAAKVGNV